MHTIRLLGSVTIDGPDGRLTGRVVPRARMALLAALAVSPTRSANRERLMALLWPESDMERARHLLRDTVYRLREMLGEGALRSIGDNLDLDATRVCCDLWDFEGAVARGDLEEADRLYVGPFLDGFFFSDSPEFERWVDAERARLGALHTRVLESIATRHNARGEWASAVLIWRRLASADPHNGRVAVHLMEALDASGDRAGALKYAALHAALLQSDFDAAPDPVVSAYADQLRTRPRRHRIERGASAERAVAFTDHTTPDEPGSSDQESRAQTPPQPERVRTDDGDRGSRALVNRIAVRRFGRLGANLLAVGAVGIGLFAFLENGGARDRSAGAAVRIGSTRRLTSDDGAEIQPAISPDGKLVAYAAGRPTHMRIFVRAVSGGRTISLTNDSTTAQFQPRWSPDGSQILYLTPDGVFVADIRDGATRRIAVTTDTSAVLGTAGVDVPTLSAAWSPDGQRVFVAHRGSSAIVRLDGSIERSLGRTSYELHSCDWSPRGDWIACVSGNPNSVLPGPAFGNLAPSALLLVPAAGGPSMPLTDRASSNQSPAWAPDGRSLYFVSNREGTADVYSLEISRDGRAGGAPRRVSVGMGAHSIAFSRNTQRLAYVSYTARANIASIPIPSSTVVSASDARPVTSGNQVVEMLRVSRDGRWLVFDSNREGNADIYRVRLSDGVEERLTDDPADEFGGDLSPDGRELAYFSWRTGSRDIFVKALDGGRQQQVTNTPSQEAGLVWSPDGNAIAYTDVAVDAGIRRGLAITRRDRFGNWSAATYRIDGTGTPDWSPDGRFLAYARGGRVEVVAPDSGAPRIIYAPTPASRAPDAKHVVVSEDGRTLYFKAHDAKGRASIWSASVSGGAPRLLVRFDELSSGRPHLAVGAGRLFFTIEDRQSDIWVAEVSGLSRPTEPR